MSRYPYPLADDADQALIQQAASDNAQYAAVDLTDSTKKMKQALMEDAAKAAAAQIGVSIALNAIPVVGTIAAAILAVIQVASGPYNKRQVRDVIANATVNLQRKVAAVQDEVNNAALQVADDAYPGAQQLAASPDALGLGDFRSIIRSVGGAITDAGRTIAKPVAKPVARIHLKPIEYIGKGILRLGQVYARIAGDKQFEAKLDAQYGKWDAKSRHFDAVSTRLASDPVELNRRLNGDPAKYVLGKSTTDTARKKTAALLADADQQLAAWKSKALTALASDDYKAAVMLYEAKLIRQDPVMLAKAADVRRWETQANDTMDRTLDAASNGRPTESGWFSSLFTL